MVFSSHNCSQPSTPFRKNMLQVKINANGELIASRCACSSHALVGDGAATVAQPSAARSKSSYDQILKSSALIGGSQVANIAIGIVRTKAMAMLLGPAGFGLFGLFGSIQNLTQSIAGMGINSSGVRQIAEAAGSGDSARIAQTAAVLRRTAIVLGLFGAAMLLVFSRLVTRLTFGGTERTSAVSLLSIAVFFSLVSGGQGALIQGMRRIADLAKMSVLGAFFGLCAGIPLVYFFRERGVVPSLIGVAAMMILTSWWYSRKIEIEPAAVSFTQVRQEAAILLKLGSAFMASGLMTMGVAYAVRIMIVRNLGFEATGFYQSAWTLGCLYVGFILQAMGADFYPRLTANIHNHEECNRLANEQTLIGLLLSGPGVLASLTFAPFVIALLYSAKFTAAVAVLRWICLGAMLQVISFPIGFIIVAKGNQKVFFAAELAWTVVAVALAWICLRAFGLNGAGIAFFGSYVFHVCLIYSIVHRLTNFRWSRATMQTALLFLSLIAIVFCGLYILPLRYATGAGVATVALAASYSLLMLFKLVSLDNQIPRPMRNLLVRVGLTRS